MLVRWTKVLRELWGNRARTLLVVLSIAVGVMAVGTIANSWVVLINDLSNAYNATNPASAVLTLEPFDAQLVSAVEDRRDIAQAEGRSSFIVKMDLPEGGQYNLSLDAIPDFEGLAISQVLPQSGAWPPARRELLLERSYAASLGIEVGDRVAVETADGRRFDLIMAGTVHDLHVVPAGNGEIAFGYISMDTLGYLGQPESFNRLYVSVAENPLDEDHIAAVVTALKDETLSRDGFTVFTTSIPTPGMPFLTVIIQAVLFTLAVVGAFSLLLSGALVVNTVAAVITRQVKQIGVMKAIGGVQPQIAEIYLSSVAIYGLLSLFVAVPLAVLGTRGFTGIFAQIGNFDIVTTGLPPFVLVLESIVGLLVPLIAARIPVQAAIKLTVREAIQDYGLDGQTPQTGIIDQVMARMQQLPVAGALALRNTFRRRTRLLLTLLTLTLAGAIFISVLSVRASLFGTFDKALLYYGYDLSIDLSQDYRAELIEREVRRESNIVAVEGWLQEAASLERADGSLSSNYTLIGAPVDSLFVQPELLAGRWLEAGERNAVVINSDFASQESEVQVGDEITLRIGDESVRFTVVGLCTTQYSAPVIYAGFDDLGRALNKVGQANRALVQLTERDPELEASTAARIEDRFERAGILVGATTTRSDFVETFAFRFNFLIYFLIFLAFLLALVGGMGLAGTMSLNVLERVREIGVMRAIGASNRAVQRVVLTEGMVIGAISWVFAVIVALPLASGLAFGIGMAFGGNPLSFEFSLPGAGIWLALALGIAAISSYIPARRASDVTVREVLAYD